MASFQTQYSPDPIEVSIDIRYGVIRKGLNFLVNNFEDPISLADLSHVVQASRFHYCRLFKKVMGIGPGEWLIGFRVLHAVNMMESLPNAILRDIAFPCGFRSSAHFCRTFKKFFGHSPLEFREHLNKKNPNFFSTQAKINDLRNQLHLQRLPKFY